MCLFLTTYSFGLHHKKHGGLDKIYLKGGNRAKGYLKQTEKEEILSERVVAFKEGLGKGSSVIPLRIMNHFFPVQILLENIKRDSVLRILKRRIFFLKIAT